MIKTKYILAILMMSSLFLTKLNAQIPSISKFTPTNATTGDTVTIKGINFTSASTVSFGAVNANSFSVLNDSTIKAIVGNGASGSIVVVNNYGSNSLSGFVYRKAIHNINCKEIGLFLGAFLMVIHDSQVILVA